MLQMPWDLSHQRITFGALGRLRVRLLCHIGCCKLSLLSMQVVADDDSVFGGASIVLGLLTYGYQVMKNLGNRLTLMSPSRGFCMELGSAMTVLMATRLALPVSTVCIQSI